MSTKDLVDAAVEHLYTRAGVKTVYGEPVVVDGKTIIPVAKVVRFRRRHRLQEGAGG